MDKISEYRQKRNFDRSYEPESANYPMRNEHSGGFRFVVQHHMASHDHYDFRLEWDGVLLSWAVPKGPSYDTRDKRLAVHVEDHPLEYRNFEGTIPKGEYGGGTVMLWDEGFWEPREDMKQGLFKGQVKMNLSGTRLRGKWALIRLKGKKEQKSRDKQTDNWLLLKERDEYAGMDFRLENFTTSVRTGRTMAEIEEGTEEKIVRNPFRQTKVQLAKLVHQVPKEKGWLYEMKYDGYRIVAFAEENQVRLMTRNGVDVTEKFSDIAHSIVSFAKGRALILDGEMTVTDSNGRTDFQALQDYLREKNQKDLTYIIFDLLALDGTDIRDLPLAKRKEKLERLLEDAPENLYYSRHVRDMGNESFAAAEKMGMEGIIGKREDCVYSGTRNGDWIKLKCVKRQEFVIGGYAVRDDSTRQISSLLLGAYQDNCFLYVGRVGTGFKEDEIQELLQQFSMIKRIDSPFLTIPKPRSGERVTWVKPKLLAEVKFAQWTKDHILRHASFLGLRTDKDPLSVRMEIQDGPDTFREAKASEKTMLHRKPDPSGSSESRKIGGVIITHPDKLMFEEDGITKGEMAEYYAKVSKRMLPYVSKRLLSLVCCPKGIAQTSFFKKHPASADKKAPVLTITENDGEESDYLYIDDLHDLLLQVQNNAVEFHTWGSRTEDLEKPDVMVFDLDPDEGMDLARVRQGVLDIRNILTDLSLTSYLKTSGGKGYHIVVPFQPGAGWESFSGFARKTAEVLEQQWPDRYTSNIRKAKRKGRIFIDWIRNGRGATSVAPYSIRARKGARVSMPITWDELKDVDPDGITMEEALKRLQFPDPWAGFYESSQRLNRN